MKEKIKELKKEMVKSNELILEKILENENTSICKLNQVNRDDIFKIRQTLENYSIYQMIIYYIDLTIINYDFIDKIKDYHKIIMKLHSHIFISWNRNDEEKKIEHNFYNIIELIRILKKEMEKNG